jgi:spore coat polysaccharide biosynthesis predicted glycosyltransferase SpsG
VADASAAVGLGHLMRCRALVESIRERLRRTGRRASVTFTGRYDQAQARRIRAWGYALAAPSRERRGAHPRQDLVILDAYRPLVAEMRAARASGARIVLFDDGHHGGRPPVDVRLIPNRILNRIRNRLDPSPRSGSLDLVGPRYLCLRPEVARARGRQREKRRRRHPSATRVFVSLGGGRTPGLERLVEALRKARLRVDEWAVAGNREARGAVWGGGGRGSGGGKVRWATEPGAVARAMARSTAAVGAAGTTAWELACLGVPAVLVTRAANQVPIARALDHRAALWCGGREVLRGGRLPEVIAALRRLLGDRALRRRLSRTGRRLADGRGAERAAAAILRRVDNRHRSD